MGLRGTDDYNRAYGLDLAWQTTTNGKLFAFISRTDSPAIKGGSDYAGRAYYQYANPFWNGGAGYAQVGDHFNPEVGFLPRRAYRMLDTRNQSDVPTEAVAVDSSLLAAHQLLGVHGSQQQSRDLTRALPLLRDPGTARRALRVRHRDAAGSTEGSLHGVPGCDRTSRGDSGGRVLLGDRAGSKATQTRVRRSMLRCGSTSASTTTVIISRGSS